jgi:myo-inositol-1(or 4)-monophosphatase
MTLTEKEIDRAMDVARELGTWAIATAISMEPGEITYKKSAADFVTEVDVKIETYVRKVIQANFPDHNFVGEEMGGEFKADTPTWYLDPIDGTTNFANHLPWISFSLALAINRTPLVGIVTDPWRNQLFEAQAGKGAKCNGASLRVEDQGEIENPLSSRTVATELAAHAPWPGMYKFIDNLAQNFCTTRIMGSGTLTMVGVALQRGVGAVVENFSPIDHLASLLIVHEAGGVIWDQEGKPNLFPQNGGVMAATQAAAAPLYAIWMKAIEDQQ